MGRGRCCRTVRVPLRGRDERSGEKGESMRDRRVRSPRRLTAWLVAAVLGAAGAITIATPAQAAGTCAVRLEPNYWPAADGRARWEVRGLITNTGTVAS